MRSRLHKIEHFVDKSIPYLLVILIIITLIDVFYVEIAERYLHTIEFIDNIVIAFFITDLAFKYKRASNIPQFIKNNWIDIIAVMPFYFMFRLVDEFLVASELIKESQQSLHVAAGVEKEATTAAKELKDAKMITRSEKMLKEIKIFSRIPRFVKALDFFEKPNQDIEISLSADR